MSTFDVTKDYLDSVHKYIWQISTSSRNIPCPACDKKTVFDNYSNVLKELVCTNCSINKCTVYFASSKDMLFHNNNTFHFGFKIGSDYMLMSPPGKKSFVIKMIDFTFANPQPLYDKFNKNIIFL